MASPEAAHDLIVVGAGINGAGVARDAAMRGLRVLLLDKEDLGGGTTSRSTRLIHGGLRYLEHGEVGLVRESLRERERLLWAAPHLVRPLPLVIPLYRGGRRGPLTIRAGMAAYDLLSLDKSLDRHRMLRRDEALALVPGLQSRDLLGAARYHDAQAEYAERLVVENVVSAERHGAAVRTHTRVDGLLQEGGCVVGVRGTGADGAFTARAPVVVNAGGPWIDAILAGTGEPRLGGGTKGSHIVVAPFPGAPAEALYVEARADGRPFFVVPWNDLYLIGTTDLRHDGPPDDLAPSEAEIAYLLAETDAVLPRAGLRRGDVLYGYAGVRPLPNSDGVSAGAITRRHAVHDHGAAGGPQGLLTLVGGKLTTYRELAEETVDAALRALGRPVAASPTLSIPLPGGELAGSTWDLFAASFPAESGLPERSARRLMRVYGTRALAVGALATEPDLREPFDPDSGAIGAEVVFAVREEGAVTLADILLRRTMVGLGPRCAVGADVAAAAVACRHLGWDAERAAAEVAAYRAELAPLLPRALGWGLDRPS